jgi:hypothetical protein
MRHVLASPASDAQRDKATEFLAVAEQEIKALEDQVGDPTQSRMSTATFRPHVASTTSTRT